MDFKTKKYMSEDNFEKLIMNLHFAQEKKDKNLQIKANVDLGIYHYQNEDFQKAKLSFENVLKINKNIIEINYYLALISLQNEKIDEAKNYLESELLINPQNKDAKTILEKIKINTNFPLITITLLMLNFFVFIFTYPKITLLETIKFTLSSQTLTLAHTISSLFFHVNIIHFTINMVILLMFGIILEKHIGSIKFLFIYLISGILGNITQAILYPNSFVLGASAAIFGLFGSILLINPLLKLKLLGIFNVPLIIILGGLFAFNAFIENYFNLLNLNLISAEIAHLIGFLIGIFITSIFYHENRTVFYNWLFIFCGFWLIEYSIENIIFNLHIEIIFIISQIILISIGCAIIYLSYNQVKIKILKIESN